MSQKIINETKHLIMNHLEFLINGEGMEINEAIQELKNTKLRLINYEEDTSDKEKPLKAIKTGPWDDLDCQSCRNTVCLDEDVEEGKTPNYCKHCGQRLDWSDEHESKI